MTKVLAKRGPAKAKKAAPAVAADFLDYYDVTKLGISIPNSDFSSDERTSRQKFRPLRAAERFFLLSIEWCERFPRDWGQGKSEKERDAIYDDWKSRVYDQRMPAHVLDIPDNWDKCPEGPEGDEDLPRTRAEAFGMAAEWNSRIIVQDETYHSDWWAVFEFGQPLKTASVSIVTTDPGRGYFERSILQPIRIVRPTAAEIKKFAGARKVVST